MSDADRDRQYSAMDQSPMQQPAAERADARRRVLIVAASMVAVFAVVVGIVVAKALSTPASNAPSSSSTSPTGTTDAAVANEVTSVPASVLNAVGGVPKSVVSPLVPVSGSLLTSGGKPEMLYVGAEYCPFCAAERWAMAVALSRFGTFTNLHFIHSDGDDVYSNTATLTFYKSSYTSPYLVFTPVETTTPTKAGLQNPTAAQLALMSKYDVPPYVPPGYSGAFPFVDIGNKYITDGSQYLPSALGSIPAVDPSHFGLSWAQIGQDLHNASSPVAQAILGSANDITAAICKLTHGQPGGVCNSPAVTSVGSQI